MSDAINSRLTFSDPWEIRNCWMVFRLQDGTTDGNLYDTKSDAIRHVSDYKYWAFFCFRNAMGGVRPFDCQIFLEYHRHLYRNGGTLPDPDGRNSRTGKISGGPDLIIPTGLYDKIMNRQRLESPLAGRVKGYG